MPNGGTRVLRDANGPRRASYSSSGAGGVLAYDEQKRIEWEWRALDGALGKRRTAESGQGLSHRQS